MTDTAQDSVTGFDFLYGSWEVVNRRLTKPLTGSDEWTEFPATLRSEPRLSGTAVVEEMTFPTLGFQGLTLRLYDPERREWSVYWVNSRTGLLQAPVVGEVGPDGCDLFGDDTHEGVPIRVRYRWIGITTATPRWEQAFSVDGERTWETNWIMEHTRTA